jgi:hypothetical protein
MYDEASVLSKTLQTSLRVDPGVRYFNVGPSISAFASKILMMHILNDFLFMEFEKKNSSVFFSSKENKE